MQAPRKLSTKVPDRMGYEDFVWFMLSEEDKSTDVSLEYWFRCIDLDFDGVLRSNELLVSIFPFVLASMVFDPFWSVLYDRPYFHRCLLLSGALPEHLQSICSWQTVSSWL